MEHLFTLLENRRRELGMSYAVLAKRSGVSKPTVVRMLQQKNYQATFAAVYAVAQVLGVRLESAPAERVDDLLEAQAHRKAQRLARMAQGTSALEGQGVDIDVLERVERRSAHKLLAGSRRNLWAD